MSLWKPSPVIETPRLSLHVSMLIGEVVTASLEASLSSREQGRRKVRVVRDSFSLKEFCRNNDVALRSFLSDGTGIWERNCDAGSKSTITAPNCYRGKQFV